MVVEPRNEGVPGSSSGVGFGLTRDECGVVVLVRPPLISAAVAYAAAAVSISPRLDECCSVIVCAGPLVRLEVAWRLARRLCATPEVHCGNGSLRREAGVSLPWGTPPPPRCTSRRASCFPSSCSRWSSPSRSCSSLRGWSLRASGSSCELGRARSRAVRDSAAHAHQGCVRPVADRLVLTRSDEQMVRLRHSSRRLAAQGFRPRDVPPWPARGGIHGLAALRSGGLLHLLAPVRPQVLGGHLPDRAWGA